ncbi:MAG: hypothetical protein HQL51_03855 [Magnetococcales bacterium]|nr:hypothetical protein [Magnetococcales bacterium]
MEKRVDDVYKVYQGILDDMVFVGQFLDTLEHYETLVRTSELEVPDKAVRGKILMIRVAGACAERARRTLMKEAFGHGCKGGGGGGGGEAEVIAALVDGEYVPGPTKH